MIFFRSFFTNLVTSLVMVDKTDIDNFLEVEIFLVVEVNTSFFFDVCPMAFLHTISAKSNSNRYDGLECINLFLNLLGNIENLWHISISEVSESLVDSFQANFKGIFKLFSGKFLPPTVEPSFFRSEPSTRGTP